MGQEMFSFVDLLVVGAVALALGALATVVFLSSAVHEMRTARSAATRQRRQAAELLRLAEQPGALTGGAWNADLLRRVQSERLPLNRGHAWRTSGPRHREL
ncbi:hypothetical protein Cme02nite_64980 [Catellatospora methionotrophica]|uniref:Uncharacterized protein n=1 Tax=Catellatospora methionotrophica TaxID=121620 RepID=A0A8J3PHS1_9ACTN|nr:hypothetical protein [Catellatospora methionotrophica]GIG18166.1 hypothetical protein Cme02nite_64980 [Catellatospora methionotrophica]